MANRDLLVEIGTEELPPKSLLDLSLAFQRELETGLAERNLAFSATRPFATPRRLAVIVSGLQARQEDSTVERFGPAVNAAFDDHGKPTRAAEGFARSCGVEVADLEQKNDGKVAKLYYQAKRAGEDTTALLPELINAALAALPIPRRMRWGSSREEFVRPVHWAVVLFGADVVECRVLGVQAGRETRGHRFHHPALISLATPADYESVLAGQGRVIARFEARRENIETQIRAQAKALGANVAIDPDLLDEVTALVEWPVALTGAFDRDFLAVPKEALVSSMKQHQKCFYLEDDKGQILPHFITISNLQSTDSARVVAGNEKVIRPRLADAAFFFAQDKKQPLSARQEKLASVVFEQSLGTVYDKSVRVASLAEFIAGRTGADKSSAVRAAQLAKCDLLTGMVGEFAELQGIMGYYYAMHDGEPEEVARAINEQYLPRYAGDALPETATGMVLALAERIDTIVGLFGIGQPPTGSKDPYALRRAALGILRIIVEKQLDLDLADCVRNAISHFPALPASAGLDQAVLDFIFERFRAWYADEGVHTNIFQAVDAVRPHSPLDFHLRIKAVTAFSTMQEAQALAMANKRVSNILAKLDRLPEAGIEPSLLAEKAEKQLANRIDTLMAEVGPLLKAQDYTRALSLMASLQADVDKFFDEVMVNTEDDNLRQNRQSLLLQLRRLFLQIADISHLQAT